MSAPKRVGVLVPSTNQVVEPDFYSVVSKEITVHAERLWNGDPTPPGESEADNEKINHDLERAARYIASLEPDLVVYACTGGTFFKGNLAYDREISAVIQRVTGRPAITAVGSSVAALRHVGARRISIAGPYGNRLLRERLKPLIEGLGFDVVSADGEPEMAQRTRSVAIGNQDPQVILDFVPGVVKPEADTVFLPGTAWRTLEVVDELERKLRKTVITVNQATIWNALGKLGWRQSIDGYGQLLRTMGEVWTDAPFSSSKEAED